MYVSYVTHHDCFPSCSLAYCELEFSSVYKSLNVTWHIFMHTAYRCHLYGFTAKTLHFTAMATLEHVTVGLAQALRSGCTTAAVKCKRSTNRLAQHVAQCKHYKQPVVPTGCYNRLDQPVAKCKRALKHSQLLCNSRAVELTC